MISAVGGGGRLLGALSQNINYFGTDPNYLLVEKLNEINKVYQEVNEKNIICDIRSQGSEVFIPEWENKMGLAFSSPPYFDLEDYRIGDQSYKAGDTSYEGWLNNYLTPTIKNVHKYLIDDGYFIINIKNYKREKYVPCADDAVKLIKENGFKLVNVETLHVDKRCHIKCKENNNEDIFVFKKK